MLIHMALRAGKRRMFTCQRKSKNVVIEIIAKSIAAIMTVETCLPKRNGMIDHEGHIDLTMTLTARCLIKARHIIFMTITT